MKNLEELTREEGIGEVRKLIPFGAKYMEKPEIDKPGEVYEWKWNPSVQVVLEGESASWPGTTGTGPTSRDDERYGESG